MERISAAGVTTKGLDVSHYDGLIDFSAVRGAGFVFCQAKCTEGTAYVDGRYKANKSNAKAAGLFFGAYHFFRPASDPNKQAEHFLKNADLKPGDMQPMFDWEIIQDPRHDWEKAELFLKRVEREIGKKMIIYGGPYFLDQMKLPAWFADHPLWVAHYGTKAPLVPAPWKTWSFWQYSDKGSVPGIPAPDEDMDLFNGPKENVLKFTI